MTSPDAATEALAEYAVVTSDNHDEVWASGFYGDTGRERAQRLVDEGYWHRLMYQRDRHKTLIVSRVIRKARKSG